MLSALVHAAPSADVAVKIASALNVSVEYLVNGKSCAEGGKKYSPEIRKMADKLESMSSRDRKNVGALIDAICEDL